MNKNTDQEKNTQSWPLKADYMDTLAVTEIKNGYKIQKYLKCDTWVLKDESNVIEIDNVFNSIHGVLIFDFEMIGI